MSLLFLPRTIYGKLILSFSAIFVLSGFAALAAIYSLYSVEGKIGLIESFYGISQKILEVRSYEKNFLLYENRDELVSAMDKLEDVRAIISGRSSQDAINHFVDRGDTKLCLTELDTYSGLMRQLTGPGYDKDGMNNLKVKLREAGHAFMNCTMGLDSAAKEHIAKDVRRYKAVAFVLVILILPMCAFMGIILANWIMTPLRNIRRSVAQVMKGDISSIPVESTKKICVECAELIDALNKMLQTISDKHQQFMQTEKLVALGKVTAGIAHEINNPLNNISLTAEMLMEDLSGMDCDERRSMIRDIVVQVDRAREIVRNLLDFSRPRKPSVWVKVDLRDLLNNTLAFLKNQVRLSGADIKIDIPETPVITMGNPSQLQQVFVNIILNALQAMDGSGALGLKVFLRAGEDRAVVEISDTGPGIPPEVREHIFEPFFTTKSDGTGLGLSVSYGIIKEHKGDISVSSGPGGGTTFRVELPLWYELDRHE
ncbi:MAG: ATP-binding protein [Desulfobacteraceae bacterium]|nr:ATP-binding protein [Desulfobacteraceae bacterium]